MVGACCPQVSPMMNSIEIAVAPRYAENQNVQRTQEGFGGMGEMEEREKQ